LGHKGKGYLFPKEKVKAPTYCKKDNRLGESSYNSIRELYVPDGRLELLCIIFKNSFLLKKKIHAVHYTEMKLLLLFNEVIAVYSENYTININIATE